MSNKLRRGHAVTNLNDPGKYAGPPVYPMDKGHRPIRTPHACPICKGEGMIWPYDSSAGDTGKITCHGCTGTGIVWSYD